MAEQATQLNSKAKSTEAALEDSRQGLALAQANLEQSQLALRQRQLEIERMRRKMSWYQKIVYGDRVAVKELGSAGDTSAVDDHVEYQGTSALDPTRLNCVRHDHGSISNTVQKGCVMSVQRLLIAEHTTLPRLTLMASWARSAICDGS